MLRRNYVKHFTCCTAVVIICAPHHWYFYYRTVFFMCRWLVLLWPAELPVTLAATASPHDITPLAGDSQWYVCHITINVKPVKFRSFCLFIWCNSYKHECVCEMWSLILKENMFWKCEIWDSHCGAEDSHLLCYSVLLELQLMMFWRSQCLHFQVKQSKKPHNHAGRSGYISPHMTIFLLGLFDTEDESANALKSQE